jgi:microcystin-dependent protein
MRGRLPIHAGDGPGLSSRRLGSKGGAEKETVTVNQLPSHSHTLKGSNDVANQTSPANDRVTGQTGTYDLYQSGAPAAAMDLSTIGSVGGSQSHNNLMPYLCVHFIIALFGIYPSRH